MLKYLKLVPIFCLGIAMSLFSCKKEKQNEIVKQLKDEIPSSIPKCPPGEDPIAFYSDLFLTSSDFEIVIDKFGNNAFNIFKTLHEIGGDDLMKEYAALLSSYTDYRQVEKFYVDHKIDPDAMLTSKAEILASLVQLYKNNPDFYAMKQVDQVTVITNVLNKLQDPEYNANNSRNPVVIRFNQVIALPNGGVGQGFRLTVGEVTECLLGAISGPIYHAWSLIMNVYDAVTGGNLGWGGILSVCKSALLLAMSGSALGPIVEFGLCVAWDAIW